MKIEIKIADISKQPSIFDAVVNSANANLRMGSGVAGAIHIAAGPELEAYCHHLAPLELGKAVITPGFSMPNRWIIHVRSAHYLNDEKPEAFMVEALRSVFRLAGEHNIKALALPAIGTGVFKFPHDLAADIIIKVIQNDAPQLAPGVEHVRICLPTMALVNAFDKAIQLNDASDQRPKTVDEAVKQLFSTLSQETLHALAALKEEELIQSHFGLALSLRDNVLQNNYSLRADTGKRNLDDVSGVLVRALWNILQNQRETRRQTMV